MAGLLAGYVLFTGRGEDPKPPKVDSIASASDERGGTAEAEAPLRSEVTSRGAATKTHNLGGIELTDEEVELQRQLQEQKLAGSYVLRNDFPFNRKFLELAQAKAEEQLLARRGQDLDTVFAELGFSPSESEQLKQHLVAIAKASTRTEAAMMELMEAQHDYEKRLRESLPESEFERYKKYEESQSAVREYEKFVDYLQEQQVDVDPLRAAEVVAFIEEAAGLTQKGWGGPFDGVPAPALGNDAVKHVALRNIEETTAAMESVLTQIGNSTLPEEYKQHLGGYYASQLAAMREGLRRIENPTPYVPPHARSAAPPAERTPPNSQP